MLINTSELRSKQLFMSAEKIQTKAKQRTYSPTITRTLNEIAEDKLQKSWSDNEKQLEAFFSSERFKYSIRPYNAQQVAVLRNTFKVKYPAASMSKKLYWMLRECFEQKTRVHTWGAADPVQVINLSKYLRAVYVSGWQCSSMASSSNEPGPDFADYPANTVPNKVQQLFKAQLYHDARQSEERSRMTDEQRKQTPAFDFMAPMIADADTGFGGPTAVMKLTKMFIEAGAAGIHLEDQKVGAKKCGHMSGKVLVSNREFINKLISARLQADICGVPLVIVGRTDSLSAKLIDSNVDPTDQPYILGIWDTQHPNDLKTYPEAGEVIIKKKFYSQPQLMQEKLKAWSSVVLDCGLDQAKKLASRLGFEMYFDWDTPRTYEGFYQLRGQDVKFVVHRMRQFVHYCDMIWIETDTPDLKIAKALSDGIHETHPNTLLAYNLSPSFNWDAFGFSDQQLMEFSKDLGRLGYVFQFITLAGFHMDALISEKFSKDYAERDILAYVQNIQRKEREHNVDQLKHQKWSGAELADRLMTLGTIESSTLSSGKESTEHQFDTEPKL
jgi:isocitrate lyase